MAIVGAAVVPAIQGYIADMFHSLQLSFWFLCSALSMSESTSGVKAKYVMHWLKSQSPEENRYEYAYLFVAGAFWRKTSYLAGK